MSVDVLSLGIDKNNDEKIFVTRNQIGTYLLSGNGEAALLGSRESRPEHDRLKAI